MSTNKVVREVVRIAEANGLSCQRLTQNKHIKIAITRRDRTTRTLTLSVSTGDVRSINNIEARLRRFARGGYL